MKNLAEIRNRYIKEPFNRKLGHLASDLARISTFSENSMNTRIIKDILEESKFFIEWTAPDAPIETQAILVEIQSKLALWHLYLIKNKKFYKEIAEIKELTKNWSNQLLSISGLLVA